MKIHFIGLLLCSLFIFAACEDDPSSVGQGLLEDQDVAKFYSINSNEDNLTITTDTYLSDITYGLSSRTLVGAKENLKISAVLRFEHSAPDTISEAISKNELTVESSSISFGINYNFGNETANNVFQIFRIKNEWSSTDFSRESLAQITHDNLDLGSNYVFTDSSITIDFDNQTAFEWLANKSDTNLFSNYGIMLSPVDNSNRILGFAALASSVQASDLPTLTTIVKFSNGDIDTVEASLRLDAFAVEGTLPEFSEPYSILQGGLPVRSNLKLDLSSLPKTAVVVNAEFSIQFDSLKSEFGSKSTDSLVVSLLKDEIENEIDSTVVSLVLKRENSGYKGDIKSFIQLWIDEKSNNGMQMRLIDENRAVSKLALYNENNNEALKPHLKIIYTDIK